MAHKMTPNREAPWRPPAVSSACLPRQAQASSRLNILLTRKLNGSIPSYHAHRSTKRSSARSQRHQFSMHRSSNA
eukprot:6203045-Pleurochrysis_carterae.AAC.3